MSIRGCQCQAVLPEFGGHGVQAVMMTQPAAGQECIPRLPNLNAAGQFSLPAIGSHQRRPAKHTIVRRLAGIDEHGTTVASAGRDDASDQARGTRPQAVVGNEQRLACRDGLLDAGHELRLESLNQPRRRGVIDAKDLMGVPLRGASNESPGDRSGVRGRGDDPLRVHAGTLQPREQLVAGLVVPDDSQGRDTRLEAAKHRTHAPSAGWLRFPAIGLQHQHGRLGADPLGVSPRRVIQQQISQHGQPRTAQALPDI